VHGELPVLVDDARSLGEGVNESLNRCHRGLRRGARSEAGQTCGDRERSGDAGARLFMACEAALACDLTSYPPLVAPTPASLQQGQPGGCWL